MSEYPKVGDMFLDQPAEWFDDEDAPELSAEELAVVTRFGFEKPGHVCCVRCLADRVDFNEIGEVYFPEGERWQCCRCKSGERCSDV